jgi:hypothetical protein
MKPVFDKLNLKDETEIVVLNSPDSFEPELQALAGITILRNAHQVEEIAFSLAFVKTQQEVDTASKAIAEKAKADAIVWFAYPKGTSKKYKCDLSRDRGWDLLGQAGFERVRQVAIDEDWTALRFRRVEYIKTMTRRESFALTDEGKAKASQE